MDKYLPSQTVLLIGTAERGEYWKPRFCYDKHFATETFGGELARHVHACMDAGAPRVWAVRVFEDDDPDQIYFQMDDLYKMLFAFPADIVVPTNVFPEVALNFKNKDGQNFSFARQLATFCMNSWEVGSYKLGLIGMNPGLNDVTQLINSYHFYDDMIEKQDGVGFEVGQYIGLCALSAHYQSEDEASDISLVSSLAGAIANRSTEKGLSNTLVPGLKHLNYDFHPSVYRQLSQHGIMTVVPSRHGNVLYKSITGSKRAPYDNFSAMRALGNILASIDEKSDKLVGNLINPSDVAHLNTVIDSILSSHAMIKDYSFSLEQYQEELVLIMDLMLHGEITSMQVTHNLRKG